MRMLLKMWLIAIIGLAVFSNIFPKDKDFELGKRYLKLGNTYREAHNFDLSLKYLDEGRRIVEKNKSWEGKYWLATAYEFLGYYYRDKNDPSQSKIYLEKALNLFRQIIKQKDGSQAALDYAATSIQSITDNLDNMQNKGKNSGLIINFSNRKLKELPSGIPDNVVNLAMTNNRFTDFPIGLTKFKKLEYIDLSHNRIRYFPENVDGLKKLHYLNLSYNKLNTIPPGLSALTNLTELNLEKNQLKTLPLELCSLKNLKTLNLKKNHIVIDDIMNIVRCLPNTNVLFDSYKGEDSVETSPVMQPVKPDSTKPDSIKPGIKPEIKPDSTPGIKTENKKLKPELTEQDAKPKLHYISPGEQELKSKMKIK